MAPPEPREPWALRSLRAIGTWLLRIPRRWAFVPVLGWAGLIFFMSSRAAPSFRSVGPFSGVFENFGHALEYGVFAVCLALAAPRKSDARGEWVDLGAGAVVAILSVVLVYAASDEWHQSFVPKRDASVFDVLTDVVGGTATLACIAAIAPGGTARGSGRVLWVRFGVGLLACIASAALATYGPKLLGL